MIECNCGDCTCSGDCTYIVITLSAQSKGKQFCKHTVELDHFDNMASD